MKNNIIKNSLILMVITMLAKVLGFIRELVLASTYGASMYSDAYLIAINIPTVIFAALGISISTIFIPLYIDIENNKGKKDALKFTNNIFNIISIVCIILSVIGYIFAEEIINILAIGFSGEALDITVDFTRILMIGIVFIVLTYLCTAFLQVKGNFVIPGIVSLPYNLIIITSIIVSSKYNSYIMVWGTLIGILIQFIFQVPFMYKIGFKYDKRINIKDENIKRFIFLVTPVFIGVAVNQINAMVDRTLASTLVEGSISALNYANKLNMFVMALFITSISSVIYPLFSKLSVKEDNDEFIKSIIKTINCVTIIIIPISIGAIVLSQPIIKLLFERGEFGIRETKMTTIALIMYSIGMCAFALRDILGKVFYSLKDTKTPMINGIITVVLNIIINLILIKEFKLAGLALSTSISSTICILLLFRSLKKKIGYFGQDKILGTVIKSLISGIIMGGITIISYKLLFNLSSKNFVFELISLFISIGVGAVSYGILLILLNVDEINNILSMLKNQIRNILLKINIVS